MPLTAQKPPPRQPGLAPFCRTVGMGNLVQFGFKVDGAEIVKTGVESGAVIEGLDVVEDGGASVGAGGKAVVIDQFVFEAAPKGFDKGVIVAVAWATHGSEEAVLGQELSISGAGKL